MYAPASCGYDSSKALSRTRPMKDNSHSTIPQADARADDFPVDALFAAASTAVLVADGSNGRVIAANPAAQQFLGLSSAEVVGYHWREAFDSRDAQELNAAARQASTLGTVVSVPVRAPGAVDALRATISTFFVSKVSYLLFHLDAADESGRNSRALSYDLFDELDDLPMGFVITDGALRVEFGNREFLNLTGKHSRDAVEGQNLLYWLDLTQNDLNLMCRQIQLREAATFVTTNLRTSCGPRPMVEVIAIAVPDAMNPHWGFVLRQITQSPSKSRSLRDNS